MKKNNILELVGQTPVVKLHNLVDNNDADVYVKLENLNLTGSIKVRPALQMIKDGIDQGIINEDSTLVEATSGNMGIALAFIANYYNLKIKIVMPESMSVERRNIMASYNAELILTDAKLGMKGAIEKTKEIAQEENHILMEQFSNSANVKAHYLTTAPELLEDFDNIDAMVIGVGTGGTITGIANKFKEENKDTKFYAVEPKQSAVLSGDGPSPHKIQGIGAGFVPDILDVNVYDEIIQIDGQEAMEFAKEIYLKEGLYLGISSAANILAAIQVAKKLKKGKTVVTIA
ncbi:MAG: cysteine synthase A, partial [Erysipelotrichales bacterium]